MGLMKFLTRKGAVGGTARLIAKQYKHYRTLHPDKEAMKNAVIYRLIIMDRFKIIQNKSHENILMEKAWNMSGLRELVVEILVLEAGFNENTHENQLMFKDVIGEELLKKGVPKQEV